MKHIEDVAAQAISQLNSSLDLCKDAKQRRAMERAISWLLDVTNPMNESELAKMEAHRAGLEEWACNTDAQEFFESRTDEDMRTAIEMLAGE